MAQKDEEINKLEEDLSKQQSDFDSLKEIKTALDMEISVYRKLMESEEERLGIQGMH